MNLHIDYSLPPKIDALLIGDKLMKGLSISLMQNFMQIQIELDTKQVAG